MFSAAPRPPNSDSFSVCLRCERLEDQLNDLTDLHQHETGNLKQELASIEEKVAYQAYERARDIQVTCPITQWSPNHEFDGVASSRSPVARIDAELLLNNLL